MACWNRRRYEQQLEEERQREYQKAIEELQVLLGNGQVQVLIGMNGEVIFENWNGAELDINDACAFVSLQNMGSWELQQAVEAAEIMAGRSVNQEMLIHSH